MGPTLKTLKLKIISNGEAPSFSSAEGELDFSKIDFTRIYKSSTTRVVKENGMDYVEPIAYTEEEASKLKWHISHSDIPQQLAHKKHQVLITDLLQKFQRSKYSHHF